MTCLTVRHGCGGPSTGVFLCRRSSTLAIRPRKSLSAAVVSCVLGSLQKGLCLSTCTFLCIVFLRVLGILSLVLGGGDVSDGLGVFDFSCEEVKRAVGLHL